MDQIACRGTRIDFTDDHPRTVAQAKEVCARCPVTAECLQQAIIRREHGVWAGTTKDERDRMVGVVV